MRGAKGKKFSTAVAAASSSRLLHSVNVKAYLEECLEERKVQACIDQAWLVEYLKGALLVRPEEAKVKRDKKGKNIETPEDREVREKAETYLTSISKTSVNLFRKEVAAEILSKYVDMNKSTVNIKTESNPVNLKKLSDQEVELLTALTLKAQSDVQT